MLAVSGAELISASSVMPTTDFGDDLSLSVGTEEVNDHGEDEEEDEDELDGYCMFLQPAPNAYNMTEKLMEANRILANGDENEISEERARKVTFKEDLVAYEPGSFDYSSDEALEDLTSLSDEESDVVKRKHIQSTEESLAEENAEQKLAVDSPQVKEEIEHTDINSNMRNHVDSVSFHPENWKPFVENVICNESEHNSLDDNSEENPRTNPESPLESPKDDTINSVGDFGVNDQSEQLEPVNEMIENCQPEEKESSSRPDRPRRPKSASKNKSVCKEEQTVTSPTDSADSASQYNLSDFEDDDLELKLPPAKESASLRVACRKKSKKEIVITNCGRKSNTEVEKEILKPDCKVSRDIKRINNENMSKEHKRDSINKHHMHKSCCRTAHQPRLPDYRGLRSEYGLTAEQLQERRRLRTAMARKLAACRLQKQLEEEERRRENEQRFNAWLAGKRAQSATSRSNHVPNRYFPRCPSLRSKRPLRNQVEKSNPSDPENKSEEHSAQRANSCSKHPNFRIENTQTNGKTGKINVYCSSKICQAKAQSREGTGRATESSYHRQTASMSDLLRGISPHLQRTYRIYLGVTVK